MLIVVEGADRTGKTTLARRLLERLPDARYIHASAPTRHPLEEYELPLKGYGHTFDHLVLDRWHLGEAIWPTIFDRPTEIDPAVLLHVELTLRSRGALLVHARRDEELLAKEIDDIGDEPVTGHGAVKAQRMFDELRREHVLCDTVVYDFDVDNSDSKVDIILDAARTAQRDVSNPTQATREWIGSPRPRALLIGDRPGPNWLERKSPSLPFVPYVGTSGHFLMSELLDVRLTDVAICNTVRHDGQPERLLPLWHDLGCPPVVALGRDAERALGEALISHVGVRHPQYSRRFERRRGPGAYGTTLIDAIEQVEARN